MVKMSDLPMIFGILGNVVSFLVYLAPVPTFYRICKRRSTEDFQAIPYSVALFSAMLTLYYGLLKTNNGIALITINSIGCAIESIYLILFLLFASGKIRIYTTKILVVFNGGLFGAIFVTTQIFIKHRPMQISIIGWICAVFSVCVFASPLSIMRLVIRTKSVEFMPFLLSFFLTISSVMWFTYGFLIHDFFVASPNILGFIFGMAQMVLYVCYKNSKNNNILPECALHEIPSQNGTIQVVDVVEKADGNIVIITERNLDPTVPMTLLGDKMMTEEVI